MYHFVCGRLRPLILWGNTYHASFVFGVPWIGHGVLWVGHGVLWVGNGVPRFGLGIPWLKIARLNGCNRNASSHQAFYLIACTVVP